MIWKTTDRLFNHENNRPPLDVQTDVVNRTLTRSAVNVLWLGNKMIKERLINFPLVISTPHQYGLRLDQGAGCVLADGCRAGPRGSTRFSLRSSPAAPCRTREGSLLYLRVPLQLPWQLGQTIPRGSHSTTQGRAFILSCSLLVKKGALQQQRWDQISDSHTRQRCDPCRYSIWPIISPGAAWPGVTRCRELVEWLQFLESLLWKRNPTADRQQRRRDRCVQVQRSWLVSGNNMAACVRQHVLLTDCRNCWCSDGDGRRNTTSLSFLDFRSSRSSRGTSGVRNHWDRILIIKHFHKLINSTPTSILKKCFCSCRVIVNLISLRFLWLMDEKSVFFFIFWHWKDKKINELF